MTERDGFVKRSFIEAASEEYSGTIDSRLTSAAIRLSVVAGACL